MKLRSAYFDFRLDKKIYTVGINAVTMTYVIEEQDSDGAPISDGNIPKDTIITENLAQSLLEKILK